MNVLNSIPAIICLFLGAVVSAGDLQIQYFPTLLYDDDPVRIHLRVGGTVAEGTIVMLTAKGMDKTEIWNQTLTPDAKGNVAVSIAASRFEAVNIFEFSLMRAGKSEDRILGRRLHSAKGLPSLRVDGLFLRDADDRLCMVAIKHRTHKLDREWQPLKWLAKWFTRGSHHRTEHILICSDTPLPAGVSSATRIIVPAARPKKPTPSALAVLAAMSADRKPLDTTTVILFAGSLDAAAGTHPRDYRLAAEAMIQHARYLKARDIRLIAPVTAPAYKRRAERLYREQWRLAKIYNMPRVHFLPTSLINWRAGGESSTVINRRSMSAEARSKLSLHLEAYGMQAP